MLQEIASKIATGKQFKAICKKIAKRPDLADDLLQHIVLLVLEGKCSNIEYVYQHGNLEYYFIRVASNQFSSTNTSTFSREMKHFEPVIEYLPIEEDKEPEEYDEEFDTFHDLEVKLTKELIAERGWYHEKIFYLYIEHGSTRKVAKATGIGYMSIYQSVKQTIDYVNNRLDMRSNPGGLFGDNNTQSSLQNTAKLQTA
jgi:DNA-directed RNA polymerase specialized sigma24 family protein